MSLVDVKMLEMYGFACDFLIYILDEKVRISLRKHPFVIEKYLLGHSEFISDFKLTKENTVYYSTSGDGTCIKWKGKGLITSPQIKIK